jgi:hypothetical protein
VYLSPTICFGFTASLHVLNSCYSIAVIYVYSTVSETVKHAWTYEQWKLVVLVALVVSLTSWGSCVLAVTALRGVW